MVPAVEVKGVTKAFRIYSERNQTLKQALMRGRRASFREFHALENVTFQIEKGSTFGVIGSNGSGKSTLLKLLAKILVPDAGSVHVEGRTTALLELGAGFHPELSGRENIFLNGAILGLPRRMIEKNYDAIVDFADLHEFIENPVKTYSSGMFARLGFSVAVHVDPDVLLIDEVLAVGDESFQRRCTEKIDDLRSGGRTCVIVSHGLGQLHALCDRIAWIEKGHLREVGEPGTVIESYMQQVHPDSVVDASGRVHTGTGEVRIEDALLLGAGGDPVVRCGSPAVLRVRWGGDVVDRDVVIGFTVRRVDGLAVASTSMPVSVHPDSSSGRGGTVEYAIPRMSLLAGTYEIEAVVTDETQQHVMDHLRHAGRFDVVPSSDHTRQAGVVDLLGTWCLDGKPSASC